MIQYYLPGVDVSQLTDAALAIKIAHLKRIRQLEANSENERNIIKNLFGDGQ